MKHTGQHESHPDDDMKLAEMDVTGGQSVRCVVNGGSIQCEAPVIDARSATPRGKVPAIFQCIALSLSFLCLVAGCALSRPELIRAAFPCALAAVMAGYSALWRMRRIREPLPRRGWVRIGQWNAYAAVVILGGGILIANAMERASLSGCQAKLERLGPVLNRYSMQRSDRCYPPLPTVPGGLVLAMEKADPKNQADRPGSEAVNAGAIICPNVYRKERAGKVHFESPYRYIELLPGMMRKSYFYLGYAMTSDGEVAAFRDAYMNRVKDGLSFDQDLAVPTGQGTNGSDRICRLRRDIEKSPCPDAANRSAATMRTSRIPVMVERPGNHKQGGNVLFLDGHVEFMPYPGKWPMTEKTIKALEELDGMGK